MKARAAFRFLRTAAFAAGLALPLRRARRFDLTNLIPDTKKKLPGERREVFPGGVPGVSQGVPPELMKGYQAQPETATAAPPPSPPSNRARDRRNRPPSRNPSRSRSRRRRSRRNISSRARSAAAGAMAARSKSRAQQSAWPAPPQPGTFSR